MAVAEHQCAQPVAGGDAEAIRTALCAAVEEGVRVGDGGSVPIDEPAQRGRRARKEWPEVRIEGKLRRQALYERRRGEEVIRRDRLRRACVVPVLGGSSER